VERQTENGVSSVSGVRAAFGGLSALPARWLAHASWARSASMTDVTITRDIDGLHVTYKGQLYRRSRRCPAHRAPLRSVVFKEGGSA
jgi:hypothetical protein